ncbi:hypothetical protein [Kitasatospora sp. NPDC088783]|uniref:hypothetical protein n=1 Tax=Kitasatospora sp. NPDC088783 TaxID=3364077 RepID=UPI003805E21D
MDLRQRVVRRNPFVTWTLNGLAAAAVLLFVHTMVRQNLSARGLRSWPWSWQLLDTQSATAALLAAIGAIVARAQFARTVRPLLGNTGWPAVGHAPDGALAWASHLRNGGSGAVVVVSLEYRLDFFPDPVAEAGARAPDGPDGPGPSTGWTGRDGAVAAVAGYGLRSGADYRFASIRPNSFIGGESSFLLGWFAEPALAVVRDLYVRVTVRDRIGDLHQRVISCLVDVDRPLAHVVPDPR